MMTDTLHTFQFSTSETKHTNVKVISVVDVTGRKIYHGGITNKQTKIGPARINVCERERNNS